MGGDEYTSETMYGYEIFVPNGMTYNKFACKMHDINEAIKKRSKGYFHITSLLECVLLDRCGDADPEDNDDRSTLLIGFQPDGDLALTTKFAKRLQKFIADSPELKDLQLSDKPRFHSGVNWFDRAYVEFDDDDDEDAPHLGSLAHSKTVSDEEDEVVEEKKDKTVTIDGITYHIFDNKISININGETIFINSDHDEAEVKQEKKNDTYRF